MNLSSTWQINFLKYSKIQTYSMKLRSINCLYMLCYYCCLFLVSVAVLVTILGTDWLDWAFFKDWVSFRSHFWSRKLIHGLLFYLKIREIIKRHCLMWRLGIKRHYLIWRLGSIWWIKDKARIVTVLKNSKWITFYSVFRTEYGDSRGVFKTLSIIYEVIFAKIHCVKFRNFT